MYKLALGHGSLTAPHPNFNIQRFPLLIPGARHPDIKFKIMLINMSSTNNKLFQIDLQSTIVFTSGDFYSSHRGRINKKSTSPESTLIFKTHAIHIHLPRI